MREEMNFVKAAQSDITDLSFGRSGSVIVL